jgi:hypothetical protein
MKDPRSRLQVVTSLSLTVVLVGGFAWATRAASAAAGDPTAAPGPLGALEAAALAAFVIVLLFPFTLLMALVLVVGAMKLMVMAISHARGRMQDFRAARLGLVPQRHDRGSGTQQASSTKAA